MGYINKSYLQTQLENLSVRISAVFAKITDIPTKVSQLENDSGYKTTDNTLTNNLLATVPGTALDAVQGKVLDDKITDVNTSLTGLSDSLPTVYEPPTQTGAQGVYNFVIPEEYEIISAMPYCNNGGFYVLISYVDENIIGVRLTSSGGTGTNVTVGIKALVKNK